MSSAGGVWCGFMALKAAALCSAALPMPWRACGVAALEQLGDVSSLRAYAGDQGGACGPDLAERGTAGERACGSAGAGAGAGCLAGLWRLVEHGWRTCGRRLGVMASDMSSDGTAHLRAAARPGPDCCPARPGASDGIAA